MRHGLVLTAALLASSVNAQQTPEHMYDASYDAQASSIVHATTNHTVAALTTNAPALATTFATTNIATSTTTHNEPSQITTTHTIDIDLRHPYIQQIAKTYENSEYTQGQTQEKPFFSTLEPSNYASFGA